MKRHMSIDQRLREYAAWRHNPTLDLPSGRSTLARIKDERHNAGAGGHEIRPDIIDGVSCRPDGGMAVMAERLGEQIARDSRCRDLQDLVRYLPQHHRAVLEATYGGPERRSIRAAADLLGITRSAYCERKAALLAWFEGAMYRSLAVG
jgi:hypothetical protein